MDFNNWWIAALIAFVLYTLSGEGPDTDGNRSTNQDDDDDDDDDPLLRVLQQQEEDQIRHDWEDQQRENWNANDD
ncbi:hypothetical protein [Hydrogenophaga sp.]|uniref:hypothetical protein n=1 Tax=Hydrogenophaga sp. TaxID=1904254 RepID=UPI00272FC4DE|nr:hypothetical protein [Hydrogenophaga sp.]MDP2015240.1 hypothetical protein [Hydrogenophaga sp.]